MWRYVLAMLFVLPMSLQAQESLDQSIRRREAENRARLEKETALNNKLYDALRQGLLNDDVRVRLKSLKGIMEMDKVEGKEGLIKDYLDDRNPEIRIEILEYYGRLTRESDTSVLLLVLEDEDVSVRTKLIETLFKFQTNEVPVYDHFKLMLEDKQLVIREKVLDALLTLKPEHYEERRLYNTIRDNLYDGVQALRVKALEIVGRFSLPLIFDSIESALQDPQLSFRKQALEIAGKTESVRSTKLLLDTMRDGVPSIRARSIEMLSKRMTDDIARMFDNHMVNEADPKLRISILRGVAVLRNTLAVNILNRGLEDLDMNVRREAVQLLKTMQESIDLDPLGLGR